MCSEHQLLVVEEEVFRKTIAQERDRQRQYHRLLSTHLTMGGKNSIPAYWRGYLRYI